MFLILTLVSTNLHSQSVDFKNYSYKIDKDYVKSYWTATKKIATGPIHWKQKEWIIAGSVVVAGAALYIYDDDIRKTFRKNKKATWTLHQNMFLNLGEVVYIQQYY